MTKVRRVRSRILDRIDSPFVYLVNILFSENERHRRQRKPLAELSLAERASSLKMEPFNSDAATLV